MKTFAKIFSAGIFIALVAAVGVGAQYYPEQYYGYYGTTTSYPTQYAYPYGYQQSYYPYTYSAVTLSQTSLNLAVGQSAAVYVQGGAQFSLSSTNWNTTWQSISGNTLTVQGINPGSTTITVCPTSGYYASNCASLYVSVGSYGSYYPSYNAGYYHPYYASYNYSLIDEETIRLDKGERETVDINRYGGRYDDAYISDNSNRRIASADIDNDELEIKGLREGSTTITVCQYGICDSVRVIVRD